MSRSPLVQVSTSPGAAKFWIPSFFLLTLAALWWSGALGRSFSTSFLPHGFCYNWEPRLVWTHLVSDLVIALSYLSISTTLAVLVLKARHEIPFSWMLVAFGSFIIACGATHLLEVVTLKWPYYWLAANVKVVTAMASLTTAIALPPLLPRILKLLHAASLSEERRVQLENTQVLLQGELETQGHTLERLATDIATRNRELQESTQKLYTTLTSIGDGVIATDTEGNVTFMNQAAEQLTGWALAEAVGKPLAVVFYIINETTRQVQESPFDKVKRVGGVVQLANHTLLITQDGREISIDDSGAPIVDSEGMLTGVILTFRDISDKRAAEEARSLLASIVNSSQDAIISRNLSGNITSWNKGAEGLYGYTSDEVMNKPFDILLPEPIRGELMERERGLLDGEFDHLDSQRRCKDGSIIDVSLTASPIYDYSGRLIGVATIGRDITAQKKAQEALRTSEKLAVTGRLAATIAHEINNPLEAVMNLLYLIEVESQSNTDVHRFAAEAQEELNRVAHITRQTLAFYRDSTNPVMVDLREVVESLLEIYKREIHEKGISTQIEMESGLAIEGLPGELRQVFANLIRNAIEAMQTHGTLRIQGRCEGEGRIAITVTDSGPGVEPLILDRIFDPFFTTKGVNGTGLGLWVTQGIVQKHGGVISVSSPPPGALTGAQFSVVLPIESKHT